MTRRVHRVRALARTALVLAGVLLASPSGAAAEPLPARLTARNARVEATLDLSAAFTPGMERELGNGLTNVIAIYVAVVPERGQQPVALYGRVVEILFDVWEETYAVTLKDPRFPQGVHRIVPNFGALRAFLSEGKDLDLGPTSALPRGRFYVEARVEVNPVSKEQLQKTREFIANPAAGTRAGGPSRSVLGAVASFLLREPDPGSNVHLFRSRPFSTSEVASR